MSAVGPGTVVTFPNQKAIIDYINNHPLKINGSLDTEVIRVGAPNGIETVSKVFANKKVLFREIEKEVNETLTNKEIETLATVIPVLEQAILSCEKIDATRGTISEFTSSIKDIYSKVMQPNPRLAAAVMVYGHILKELCQNVAYTKNPNGDWIRNVEDWTKKHI